jgi:hypothetical protein
MFKQILEDGEVIELQEHCDYCGDGALALVNTGWAVLTDKRFVICKDNDAIKNAAKSVLLGGLVGGLVQGMLGGGITKNDSDNTDKINKAEFLFFCF